METVKAYVLVDAAGNWLTRPFGSAETAVEVSKKDYYKDEFQGVVEITLVLGGSCNPFIHYGRITE